MEHFNPDLSLTSTQAAELLDVHPSTVKRWCNDGALASSKTDGGHRRIHLEDLQLFARENEIDTILSPFHPYEPHVWTALQELQDEDSFRRFHSLAMSWVFRGQLQRLHDLFLTLARSEIIPFSRFCDEGIRGLMEQVGGAWHAGKLRAGEEHMVTQAMIEVLLEYRREVAGSLPRGHGERIAVVGSTEGNQHHLGSLCVRVLLERKGWEVYYLGPDVPVEDFGAIQEGRGAGLVCISLTPPATTGEVARLVRILSEFYDAEHPYTLALGGSLASPVDPDATEGPFERVDMYGSCTELEMSLDQGGPIPRAEEVQA